MPLPQPCPFGGQAVSEEGEEVQWLEPKWLRSSVLLVSAMARWVWFVLFYIFNLADADHDEKPVGRSTPFLCSTVLFSFLGLAFAGYVDRSMLSLARSTKRRLDVDLSIDRRLARFPKVTKPPRQLCCSDHGLRHHLRSPMR